MRTDRIGFPLLWRGLLAAAAGALLLWECLATSPPGLPEEQASLLSADRPKPTVLPLSLPTTYPAIAAHPVFDPSRQPWTASASQAAASNLVNARPATPPPPRGYLVVGLVTGLHQHSALLRDPSGKTVFLAEGQLLTGWTVRRIDAHGVHLQAGEDHYELAILSAKDLVASRR